MKEVVFKKPEPPAGEMGCPYGCGTTLYRDSIPCPEGKPGCLVMHYGWICSKCFKVFA